MCLTLKSSKVRVQTAKNDIICYKLIIELSDKRGYMTYFQGMMVKMGETYTSKLVRHHHFTTARPDIREGLHSIRTLERVKQLWLGTHCRIAKCIIPAGSRYYIGKFDRPEDYRESYASDMLKYVEILEFS